MFLCTLADNANDKSNPRMEVVTVQQPRQRTAEQSLGRISLEWNWRCSYYELHVVIGVNCINLAICVA